MSTSSRDSDPTAQRTSTPRSADLCERERAHLAPGAQKYGILSQIAVDHARGSRITDVDGNEYVDFIGGIGVGAIGHSHPRFVSAVSEQVSKISVGSFTSKPRVELVERLAAHAPQELDQVQLYSSGAEAIESALRLAKAHTRKHEFMSFWGGFHGKTAGALSLMGSDFRRGFGPFVPGAHLTPYADCYRCPFGSTYPECGMACAEFARKQLKVVGASLAAVVVEPMQGTAGNVIPPEKFLPVIREIANEQDALLIADEMITGFGRTGRYWGVEHTGVLPDIMAIGKAFGGGYPLSGLLTKASIANTAPWSSPSGSSSSYGGNPLGAAAGAVTLAIIDEERLVENSRAVGAWMLDELRAFEDRYPFVGHVRGLGLMLGVELVKDKHSKEPLDKRVTEKIFQACVARGLLCMSYTPSMRLQPALTIDRDTAAQGIEILRRVFDEVEREGLWR